MRTRVILHGAIATAVGVSACEFEIKTPMEVFLAIEANTGKMYDFLYGNLESEFRFVIDGKSVTSFDELILGNIQTMEVLPVLKGAGNNTTGGILLIVGTVIIAIVLTLASQGIGTVAAATGWAGITHLTATSAFFLMVGVSLTLGGISQMLSPTQKVDNTEKPQNQPSYIFNGPINTYRQGNPIPVCLGGPFRTGSQIISAGVRSVDIKVNDPNA